MRILHLAPAGSWELGGVRAYAEALAGALAEHLGVANEVVGLEPSRNGIDRGVDADRATQGVILHYSNYGFEPRGCPLWLPAGVAALKARSPGAGLLTFFHEVYATGPPWRSSFWLSPVQRRIAFRVARASDHVATSLDLYAGILGRWVDGGVPVLPVFSTVGEPESPPPPGERPPRLVVFGSAGLRRKAYGELGAALERACRTLEIEEVVDIGPPLEPWPSRPGLPRVERCGALPAAAVSALLLSSRVGFLAYPAAFLAKSTVFAAYAAHGLAAVCAWPRPSAPAAVTPDEHYLSAAALAPDSRRRVAAVARGARGWYEEHALGRQVATFARLLRGDAGR